MGQPPTPDPAQAAAPQETYGLSGIGYNPEAATAPASSVSPPAEAVSSDSVWANSTNVPNRYQQAAQAVIAKDDEQYQRNAAGSATFPGAPPEDSDQATYPGSTEYPAAPDFNAGFPQTDAERQNYYPDPGEAYFLTKEGKPDLARQKVYDDYEAMLEYSRANGLPVPNADLNE